MADDAAFDYHQTAALLHRLGASAVEAVTDPGGPGLADPQPQPQPPDHDAAVTLHHG
jgi:hypothetical protein